MSSLSSLPAPDDIDKLAENALLAVALLVAGLTRRPFALFTSSSTSVTLDIRLRILLGTTASEALEMAVDETVDDDNVAVVVPETEIAAESSVLIFSLLASVPASLESLTSPLLLVVLLGSGWMMTLLPGWIRNCCDRVAVEICGGGDLGGGGGNESSKPRGCEPKTECVDAGSGRWGGRVDGGGGGGGDDGGAVRVSECGSGSSESSESTLRSSTGSHQMGLRPYWVFMGLVGGWKLSEALEAPDVRGLETLETGDRRLET